MKPFRIISYVVGAISLGTLWPSRTKPKEVVLSKTKNEAPAVALEDPPVQSSDISENSVYRYYLAIADKFGREKPDIEVILRSAPKGRFLRNHEGGFLTFEDPETGHTLSVNGKEIRFSN